MFSNNPLFAKNLVENIILNVRCITGESNEYKELHNDKIEEIIEDPVELKQDRDLTLFRFFFHKLELNKIKNILRSHPDNIPYLRNPDIFREVCPIAKCKHVSISKNGLILACYHTERYNKCLSMYSRNEISGEFKEVCTHNAQFYDPSVYANGDRCMVKHGRIGENTVVYDRKGPIINENTDENVEIVMRSGNMDYIIMNPLHQREIRLCFPYVQKYHSEGNCFKLCKLNRELSEVYPFELLNENEFICNWSKGEIFVVDGTHWYIEIPIMYETGCRHVYVAMKNISNDGPVKMFRPFENKEGGESVDVVDVSVKDGIFSFCVTYLIRGGGFQSPVIYTIDLISMYHIKMYNTHGGRSVNEISSRQFEECLISVKEVKTNPICRISYFENPTLLDPKLCSIQNGYTAVAKCFSEHVLLTLIKEGFPTFSTVLRPNYYGKRKHNVPTVLGIFKNNGIIEVVIYLGPGLRGLQSFLVPTIWCDEAEKIENGVKEGVKGIEKRVEKIEDDKTCKSIKINVMNIVRSSIGIIFQSILAYRLLVELVSGKWLFK